MNGWVLVAVVIGFDAIFVPLLVLGLVRSTWTPLERRFPEQDREPDAVSKRFQSIRLDLCNYGFCVHLSVDARHLHLAPVWILRKAGAHTMSIPWESMSGFKQRGRSAKVKLGLMTLTAPAWAVELASAA